MTGTAAQAVVLQLPYEGVLQKGGIAFVLKQPGVQTHWLLSEQGKDFFVGFEKVRGKQCSVSDHEQNELMLYTVDAVPLPGFRRLDGYWILIRRAVKASWSPSRICPNRSQCLQWR